VKYKNMRNQFKVMIVHDVCMEVTLWSIITNPSPRFCKLCSVLTLDFTVGVTSLLYVCLLIFCVNRRLPISQKDAVRFNLLW